MEPGLQRAGVRSASARYREYLPSQALQADVYALYSFGAAAASTSSSRPVLRDLPLHDAIACAPQLADGQVSIRFELGRTFDSAGRWRVDSHALGGTVIGPMSGVGRTGAIDLSETVGAYFRPGRASRFFDVPISCLTDTAAALADVWGGRCSRVSADLADLSEPARIDYLEYLLVAQRHERRKAARFDIDGLAAAVLRRSGRVTVEGMALASGVSRQHLSRAFRERLGIGPKLYSRLARFHSVLSHTGTRTSIDWARAAFDMGFADQSHMIAECRTFSGLTPQAIADADLFHPFIERARTQSTPRRAPGDAKSG